MLTIHRNTCRQFLAMGLLVVAGNAGAAPFRIIVNDREVDTGGVPPAVINNHLLVPLAAIGNALGAYMEWRPGTRSVYGRQNMNEFTLPVNSPTAIVNGQTQSLETPASIVSGRTMVPLRFVATALGADVQFDGATRTVSIATAGTTGGNTGGTGTTTPPADIILNIDRFYVTPEAPIRPGQSFTVTLEGTPGARAEFDYGTQRNVSLPEVSPGRYSRTVQVTQTSPFSRSVVTGRLIAGNRAREVQAGERLVVDPTPPRIENPLPKAGTSVNTDQPYITAEFDDQGQTGVDENSVKLVLNGEDVTLQASVSADRIVFRAPLKTGENTVHLEVADLAGNRSTAEWRFTVTGQQTAQAPPAPTITEPDASEALAGPFRVHGTAQPGTTVRVKTTYRGTVLLVFSQQGEVNTQEVPVAANGKWQSEPITLKAPSGVSGVTYTITATAINSQGLTSEPAQVTVPRQ